MKPGSPGISWWACTDGGLGSDEAGAVADRGMETNCWVWGGGAWERLEGASEAAAELRKTKLGCSGGGGGASEYPT